MTALAPSASAVRLLGPVVDVVCVLCFADGQPLGGAAGDVDWALCGALSEAMERGRFGAALGERLLMPAVGVPAAQRLMAWGLGPYASASAIECAAQIPLMEHALTAAGAQSVLVALPAPGPATRGPWPKQAQQARQALADGLATCRGLSVTCLPD